MKGEGTTRSDGFLQLYRKEQARLGSDLQETEFGVSLPGTAQEPRVTYTARDCVGLALSGGGIRSATFNLGLLEGLREMGVLGLVNYLATVSGGGYIGGWWQAWLRREKNQGKLFPEPLEKAAPPPPPSPRTDMPEAEEIRHLREFSNFLAPRLGFFETETWDAVIAMFGVLLPSVAVAAAVIALALFAWVGAVWIGLEWQPLGALLVLPALVLVISEISWLRSSKYDREKRAGNTLCYLFLTAIALAVSGLIFEIWLKDSVSAADFFACIGIAAQGPVIGFSPVPFIPAFVWSATALFLLAVRLLLVRVDGARGRTGEGAGLGRQPVAVAALDRVIQRFLGTALVWTVTGLLWLGGAHLQDFTTWLAGGAAAGGGAFAWLRKLIGGKPAKGEKRAWPAAVKAILPQVLAYATIGLTVVLIADLLARLLHADGGLWLLGAAAALGAVLIAAIFFDPSELSLHAYYRKRIVRAYLGASNPGTTRADPPDAARNRQTYVRDGDDLPLEYEPPSVNGWKPPLHLVCCAANDVGGDALRTLSRGSRSAVLSQLGFAMGDRWWKGVNLTLGSALTASAAAFNSNMGSISMRLGSAVTFLMTALNLRLGLWVPNPARGVGWRRVFPGFFYLREMFGMTRADADQKDVHLSDGAHFENLALYELVRRHCRYIIVSDCGQDPTVMFDDFANAVRRMREDFGVEVEIDLSPLLPGPDGRARQHAAVGIIHYDPATSTGLDKGALLYFKPTLTGDEPADVHQYKDRNEAFPQETTGDQFYDEAQWESYRRLGAHAARSSLRFLGEDPGQPDKITAEALFSGARSRWYPAPPDFSNRFIELTRRCADLENRMNTGDSLSLTRELYPELDIIARRPLPASPDDTEKLLHILTQAIQLMEDVWFSAHLATHWNHPMNLGWINYFQRWAATGRFRMWWPALSPQFSPGFRQFMNDRFKLPTTNRCIKVSPPQKIPAGNLPPAGLAWYAWMRCRAGLSVGDKEISQAHLILDDTVQSPATIHRIQAAVALMTVEGNEAMWRADDLFVAPGLWGTGIGSNFVSSILEELRRRNIESCMVELDTARRSSDMGSRQELVDHINFYRSLGFTLRDDHKTLRYDLKK